MRERATAGARVALRRARVHVRRVAEAQDGFTLPELLVVLAIVGIILGGITQLFTSALRSQTDQTNRSIAQQDARLALDKLRREIHCGSAVTSNNAAPGGTWPAMNGTNAITIALGSYCPSNSTGTAAWVTWCTKGTGTGPFTLWRYPHTTDVSTANYATACNGSGTSWTGNIADSPITGGVTGGKIFTSYSQPTNPAMPAPTLTYSTTPGSLTAGTYSYIVDPMVGATEQPGTEATITVPPATTESITVDWSGSIPSYPGITGYRVYGRTPGAQFLLCQWPPPATPTCNTGTSHTDTNASTPPAAEPQRRVLARISVYIPIRSGDSSSQLSKLFVLKDNIVLRNTPR
jgi:prepilin-type N-terminal cleavage/methylation domain-containing protein